jgi:hypothetical protein
MNPEKNKFWIFYDNWDVVLVWWDRLNDIVTAQVFNCRHGDRKTLYDYMQETPSDYSGVSHWQVDYDGIFLQTSRDFWRKCCDVFGKPGVSISYNDWSKAVEYMENEVQDL